MIIVTGTKHSGGLFLIPSLKSVGCRPVAWKRAKTGIQLPAQAIVRAPISSLLRLGERSDRVIGLVRGWRAYAAIEKGGESRVPPEVTWWFQNYGMLRNLAARGSRFQLVSYDRLLSQPESTTRRVLRFVGRGSHEDFARVSLLPPVPTSRRAYDSTVLRSQEIQAFDRLNSVVDREQPLSRADFLAFNAVNEALRARYPRVHATGGLRMGPSRRAQSAAAK